nr:hypothetical protein [Tanacetum cinerariifolium]
MRDTFAHTRYEKVSKISNDPLLVRVNTPRSGEDSLKHIELMKICTTLQKKVLDLEDELKRTNTAQQTKIDGLERRERIIDDLDVDEDITLVNDQEMFDADKDLQGDEVVVEQEVVADKEPSVDIVQVSVAATTVTIDDITLAKALEDIKTSKSKIKGIVIKDHEVPSESRTITKVSSKKSQDKVEESSKKAQAEITQEETPKRAGDELEQESFKKQKIDDGTNTGELKQLVNIIREEDIAIDAIPLAVKTILLTTRSTKKGRRAITK